MSQPNNQVIIYTDNPEPYTNSNLSKYINMEFCSCPDQFCHTMLGKKYSGLVLDVRKVMQTPCCDRNRILTISSGVPTIRTLEKDKRTVFLDNHEDFICDCLTAPCTGPRSSCPINVSLPVKISMENDPAMAQSFNGTIHYISEQGCIFRTDTNFEGANFLYLQIDSLKNRLPIFAGLCSEQSKKDCPCGVRTKFLDIKNDQQEEIKSTVTGNKIFS